MLKVRFLSRRCYIDTYAQIIDIQRLGIRRKCRSNKRYQSGEPRGKESGSEKVSDVQYYLKKSITIQDNSDYFQNETSVKLFSGF